jgi:hypothetical protein
MALPAYKSRLDGDANAASITLTWLATAIDAGDVGLLFVETANVPPLTPNGWQLVGQPDYVDPSGSTMLTVFWRRFNGDETSVAIADAGDHVLGILHCFSGVGTEGDPYDHVVQSIEATSDTSVSITGGTTGQNDCLVVAAVATGTDVASTTHIGSFANADLANVTERSDDWVSTGNGGGIGVATGEKATAGDYGATTATLGTANLKAQIHIALKPTSAAAPAHPWIAYHLASAAGTGDVAPTWSASDVDANDIILVVVESGAEAVNTPSGYAAVADSPQVDGGSLTRLSAFWKRADGTETGVTVTDPGDHALAAVFAIRGCHTTGDPWDVTSGSSESTSDTSLSVGGDTSTVDNCLVVVLASADLSGNLGLNAQAKGWANSDLTKVQGRYGIGTVTGNDGAIDVASGVKASAGSYGNSTATLVTAAAKAYMTIAFKPPQAAAAFKPQAVIV